MVKSGKNLYICDEYQSLRAIVVNLIGTYECKADVKGRLMMPSPLKKAAVQYSTGWFCVEAFCFSTLPGVIPDEGVG